MIIVRGTRGYFVYKAFGCGSVNSVYNWSLDLDFRFDRVSWPIKHNVAKKIYHRVVIDKTINENMMPGFFYFFQNKLLSKSAYDQKTHFTNNLFNNYYIK